MTQTFDSVWMNIMTLEGQVFRQKLGKTFTYRMAGNAVVPDTTNQLLSRSQFEKAYTRMPVNGPSDLQDLRGPSYLFAILSDPRITGGH